MLPEYRHTLGMSRILFMRVTAVKITTTMH